MTNIKKKFDLVAIVGPTASGKSAVAFELSKLIRSEIVSIDSMSLYRGMNVGTDKPSLAKRSSITHHLIDIVDPWNEFSVAEFQKKARGAVDDIISRKVIPIVAGGSGLYVKAVIDELDFAQTPADPDLRSHIKEKLEKEGLEALVGELKRCGIRGESIDSKNPRRLIRTLEVAVKRGPAGKATGFWETEQHYTPLIFGLRMDREEMRQKIDSRVDKMYESGLMEEVRDLLSTGKELSKTASQAIGYREAIAVTRGVMALSEAIELTKKRTRALAKRQMTWFKKDKRIRWIDVDLSSRPKEIARIIKNELNTI